MILFTLRFRKKMLDTYLNGKKSFIKWFVKKKPVRNVSCCVNPNSNSVLKKIYPQKQPGLYMIKCNLTNGRYYGQSKNVSARLASHKSLLTRKIHPNTKLQEKWNLHGEKNFSFSVLFIGSQWESTQSRETKETELIISHRELSYNVLESSSRPKNFNPFWKKSHTSETKKKISQALKNRPNHLLGKKISINHIYYPSIAEASRQTGMARKTIRKRINDPDELNYVEVDKVKI